MAGEIREFLKPTPGKLFLPLLIGLIIGYSSYSYFRDMPAFFNEYPVAVEKYKNYSSNFLEASEVKYATDPQKVIEYYEKRELDRVEGEKAQERWITYPAKFTAEHFFFREVGIYKLDPYYPVPCEVYFFINFYGTAYQEVSPSCRFYLDKQSYDRIRGSNEENKLNGSRQIEAPASIKYFHFPPYQRITSFELILHASIILLEIYLLMCVIFYLPKITPSLPKWVPYAIVCILVLALVATYMYSLMGYYEYKSIENALSSTLEGRMTSRDYSVVYCNETRIVNSSRIKEMLTGQNVSDELLNKTWIACNLSQEDMAGTDWIYSNIRPKDAPEKPFTIYGYAKKEGEMEND